MTPSELKKFKERYFAAHWGQDFMHDGLRIGKFNGMPFIFNSIHIEFGMSSFPIELCSLLLTPLFKITDEDAIDVARICSNYFPTGNTDGFNIEVFTNVHGRKFVSWGLSYKSKFLVESAIDITEGSDFLRSCGYAIPFAGKSVEELIELGLLKLRE